MRRHVALLLAAMLAVVATGTVTSAQCRFPHPAQAKKVQVGLVQAFFQCISCADERFCHGYFANTATADGIPACHPPETFNEQAGSPDGWLWGPTSFGVVELKPSAPAAGTADLAVKMKLRGITYQSGELVDGVDGTLALVLRMTFPDPANGDLTTVDYPFDIGFTMTRGKTALKGSINAVLNAHGFASLPKCSNIEIVSIVVFDAANHAFAIDGVFLP